MSFTWCYLLVGHCKRQAQFFSFGLTKHQLLSKHLTTNCQACSTFLLKYQNIPNFAHSILSFLLPAEHASNRYYTMQRANHSLSNDQLHARSIQQPHPHPHPHRAACTHVRASRVFNEQVLCNHCGRPGNMGWVYRCTQDSDGRVPIDESGLDESEQYRLRELASRNGWALPGVDPAFTERMFRAEKNHNNIADLKPWMRKAASSREYTPLQITKLITQRMEVERTIWIQEMSTKDNKSVPQTAGRQQREITTGKPASVHTTGLDGQEIGASKDCVEVDMEKNLADLMAETYRKPSLCDYKCCAACR